MTCNTSREGKRFVLVALVLSAFALVSTKMEIAQAAGRAEKFAPITNNGKTFKPTILSDCSCAYYGGCGSCGENGAWVVCYCGDDPEPYEICSECTAFTKHKRGDTQSVMKASDCGTYPNCNKDACINKKLFTCKKDDTNLICSPTSGTNSSECP